MYNCDTCPRGPHAHKKFTFYVSHILLYEVVQYMYEKKGVHESLSI